MENIRELVKLEEGVARFETLSFRPWCSVPLAFQDANWSFRQPGKRI